MITSRFVRCVASCAMLVSAGCASTSPEKPFHDVSTTVAQRTDHRIAWDQGSPEDRQVDDAVRRKLGEGLTVDAAVQIALLGNRTLRATYEELSISQAELVQAGLLKNPTFSAGMTTAEADRLDPNLVVGVAQDFLDLLMIPAKKRIARAELEATKLRVGDAVLTLAAEVRSAFFEVAGAMQMVAMRRTVAESAQASAELAQRQHEAGNISDLVLANEQGLYGQIQLDLVRSEGEVIGAREKLTRLMGVWGTDAAWRITGGLPEVPKTEIPLEHLESTAIAQRLDLASLRNEAQALAYAASLVRSTRWTPGVNIGVEVARLTDGRVAVAPNASLELPIFDQKQAVLARLDAMQRQSGDRAAAKAVDIRSEVRAARDRVLLSRRLVEHYRTVLIPLRERIVALSQQEFEAMLLGTYQLIIAKQAEISTYREYIEAVRDYWLARSELERAAGGRLGRSVEADAKAPPAAPPAESAPGPATPHQHHH